MIIVNSDSGYLAYDPYRRIVTFPELPIQNAIIYYRDGYELLIIASKYSMLPDNTYKIIYYFPLPSKPLYYNVLFTNVERIKTIYTLGVDFNKLRESFYTYISPLPPLYVTSGGMSRGAYRVLGTITGETYNLSLIEAPNINISIFREILGSMGYNGSIPEGLKDIIDHYKDLGWTYFMIGTAEVTTETIVLQAYLFETDKIIYPLYLDRLQRGELEVVISITSDSDLSKTHINHVRFVRKGLDPSHIWIFQKPESMNNIKAFFTQLYNEVEKIYGDKLSLDIRRYNDELRVIIGLKGVAYFSGNLYTPEMLDDVIVETTGEVNIDEGIISSIKGTVLLATTTFAIGYLGAILYTVLFILYLRNYIRGDPGKLRDNMGKYLKLGLLATILSTFFVLIILSPYLLFIIQYLQSIALLLFASLIMFNAYHILGYYLLNKYGENQAFIEKLRLNYMLFYLSYAIIITLILINAFRPVIEYPYTVFSTPLAILIFTPHLIIILSITSFVKTIGIHRFKETIWSGVISCIALSEIIILLSTIMTRTISMA